MISKTTLIIIVAGIASITTGCNPISRTSGTQGGYIASTAPTTTQTQTITYYYLEPIVADSMCKKYEEQLTQCRNFNRDHKGFVNDSKVKTCLVRRGFSEYRQKYCPNK